MPYSRITTDLTGKVALVTASTSGIGLETALSLAELGATVILHGRNQQRGQEALQQVRARTNSDRIELELADLESQQQTRELAKRVLERHPVLDILVNNAGAIYHEWGLTEDGVERTLAVSHLASVLLTTLLLPALKRAPQARIINVSAAAIHFGRVNWDDLNSKKNWAPFRVLGTAKLLNWPGMRILPRKSDRLGSPSTALIPLGQKQNWGNRRHFPG